jgi:acylphosphatase
VFVRYSAKEKAEELGITGFARNESDGSVYIEAEGEESALHVFLEWCRRGSSSARVSKVEWSEGRVKEYKEFSMQ